jgi:FlaA1/EpsC-like NDP-sugar epimerase
MGSPYNIYNLIKKLISLYGLRIKDEKNYGDIHIKITGVRKGEKLYEELFIQDDFIKSIEKKIYVANEPSLEFDQINDISCLLIEKSNQGNTNEIKKIFSKIVEGYKLNDPIV